MLENIIASRSKVRILRKLVENKDREFTLEDLTRITNLSSGTVHPALKGLTDSRIIVIKKVGKSKVYRINKKHLLYNELENLFVRERNAFIKIASEFVSKLDKKNIKNIVLFGSIVRDEVTEKSDIDLLFIADNLDIIKDNVSKLSNKFLDDYDVCVSPVFLSVEEFRKRKKEFNRFVLKVMEEGRILYGDKKWLKK